MGNTEIATFLIKNGAHVNTKDLNGTTPLLEAVKNGHEGVAAALLQSDATLGMYNEGEYLCKVVSENDLATLKILLKLLGMDPNRKNDDGQTPLHIAAAKGYCAAAQELLETEANPNVEDSWGRRPLDEARQRKHRKMGEMLAHVTRAS